MKYKLFIAVSTIILTAVLAAACTPQEIPVTGDNVATAAAQTVSAIQTQFEFSTLVAEVTRAAAATSTSTVTPTLEPSLTPTPIPPTSTPTPTFTPTATPRPCNWAEFVADISVSDGTDFQPGTAFTKTWRLRNIGTCTWTRAYMLVFDRGDQMNGQLESGLPGAVRPGETIDVSVDLRAPNQDGTVQGFWKLRSESGVSFGLGGSLNDPFWVKIDVIKPLRTPAMFKDLTANFCDAVWSTNALVGLACPGMPGTDPDTDIGFITNFPNPHLENGANENETALVAFPGPGRNGFITGNFPSVRIESGDRFRAIIGCLADSIGCDVEFQLNYRLENSPLQTLGTWQEKYDGGVTRLDIDLTSLRGKDVEFVLTVLDNGSNKADWAFWLRPRVVR